MHMIETKFQNFFFVSTLSLPIFWQIYSLSAKFIITIMVLLPRSAQNFQKSYFFYFYYQ